MKDKSKENKSIEYSADDKMLTFNRPQIMGIVNLTPDSFYDGGKYSQIKDVLHDVEEKIEQGADLIDLGAASSRPGAIEISEEEEWLRLKNILPEIRSNFKDLLISIDTYRASIAKNCADLGANLINDISGGESDPNMFRTMSELQIPYIMMHMQGTPQTMQKNPQYEDVVKELVNDFELKIQSFQKLGFDKIILDPGFGFGKTLEQNYQLLKHLKDFKRFNFPILVGLSRKNMINKVIGTNPVTALNGTTALHTIALLNGAMMLRVHDVKEAKQAIELVKFYENV